MKTLPTLAILAALAATILPVSVEISVSLFVGASFVAILLADYRRSLEPARVLVTASRERLPLAA